MPDEVDRRPLFAIFEGGGAKGVAHIGAMQAAEERGFSFVGVAGASAGAVIAALAAVGYRSQDIFSKTAPQSNLLAQYGGSPESMLGPWKWRIFRYARRWVVLAAISGPVAGLAIAPWRSSIWVCLATCGTWLLAAGVFGLLAAYGWYRQGWFDSKAVGEFVNWALKRRLKTLYAQTGAFGETFTAERVLFRHLQPSKFPGVVCALKIIATDVDEGRLVLFDSVKTPEVEVGQAVAASIAIPLAFRPASAPYANGKAKNRLLDGGLVSNLPAWTFAFDKLAWERSNPAQGRVPVAAFRLDDPPGTKAVRNRSRGFGYLKNIARSAIFGGQEITQEFLEDLFLVTLRPALRVLEFDAGWRSVAEAIDAGYRDAVSALKDRFVLLPQEAADALGHVAQVAKEAIDVLRVSAGQPCLPALRACVFTPFGDHSLRVVHCWNMDRDADDRLSLDLRAPGAPQAFHEKDIVAVPLGRSTTDGGDYITKYERALIPPRLKTAICVPIFRSLDDWAEPPTARDVPLGVVCVDSTEDLAQYAAHDSVKRALRVASVAFASILNKGYSEQGLR